MKLLFCALASFFTASTALANEDAPFSAEAELGAIITSGNTDSTAVKGILGIKQNLTSWRTNYTFEALYKEDQVEVVDGDLISEESQVTAEKYFVAAQGDYKLNEDHRGLFVFGSYEDDRFSGYEYQATIAVGYSDQLFKTDQSLLTYSIGPGYSFYETEDSLDDDSNLIPGESDGAAIVRLAADYVYNFNENAKFTQSLAVDYAPDSEKNTKTRSETALTTKISDRFAFKASLTVTNNSEVPEDREQTDTQTALTLVYSL